MPEQSDPVVVVTGLCKTYKSGTQANRDVSLELLPSEVFCLMGPNGAGKTTFVRQVAGLLRPTFGEIEICGVSVTTSPREAKRLIGYQSQHLAGLSELTFKEAVFLIGRLRGLTKRETLNRVGRIVTLLDLASVLETRIDRLSGGYRKLLGLCLALLASPLVVVLDEPTAGLDPVHRRRVWQTIHQATENGAAVLLTSHHLDEIEDHMDRYAIMVDGRIVKTGELESLVQEARSDGVVAVRIFPRRGHDDALREDLDGIGLASRYDEDQRCYILDTPRTALGRVMDLYAGPSANAVRGLSIDRGELESAYLRALERGDSGAP